jgi:TonB-dependent receptor
MARPVLANLSPGGTVDSFNWKINFQNPDLEPTRALALDASAEWYFAKESILSLAVFRKDIESFPIRKSETGTFASTGLPESVIAPTSPASQDLEGTCTAPEGCWEISTLRNGPGAVINGLEIGFQAPFSSIYAHLPPFIRGLGIIANTTLVDSKVDYAFRAKVDGVPTDITITERLFGLSNRAFNATLYYDSDKVGARISVANRSDYLTSGPTITGNLWEFTESSTRLDFSAKYKATDRLEFSFEALNLTDTPSYTKVDIDANRLKTLSRTGRNFLVGARFNY